MRLFGILILFIFTYFSLGITCNAQSQFSDTLTRVEKSLFGVDYSAQNDDARLNRIEETVYGAPSSGSFQQRFTRVSKDLSADLIGKEIKPKADTFAEDDDEYKEPIPKADSSVNYPAVDSLENSVFNQQFKNIDINQRLAKLEQKVFNKTYKDDLSSRVDRLKRAVSPELIAKSPDEDEDDSDYSYSSTNSLMDETSQFQDNGYNRKNSLLERMGSLKKQNPTGLGVNIPDYNTNNSVLDDYESASNIDIPLSDLEKKVLKKSFPNDVTANRLIRLELKVFNSTFTDDDEQTRIDRIASAYQAQKSSRKYDNNKFSQRSAAAMQVGAILLMILAAIL